jgi:glycosyltransferase involved in cell wall biosynthesis
MSTHGPARPLVSVVIPAYNAAPFMRECLDSVFSQAGAFELDVIVVDDGSRDATVDICRGYALRCLEQPNSGPAAARNRALRHARGELVAFLDADDLWPPGKLARQLQFLGEHPDIGLVVGDCRQFDEKGPYAQTFYEGSGRNDDYWEHPVYIRRAYAKLIDANYVTTGSVVMRRACFEEAGPFDEELRLVEDLEFWLRVALVTSFGHVPEVCLLRRRHEENTSRDQVAMSRAHLRVLEKHLARFPTQVAAQGADLHRRKVREYQELGHLHARRQDYRGAMGAYGRALAARPSIRSLYYFLTALASRLGLTSTKRT